MQKVLLFLYLVAYIDYVASDALEDGYRKIDDYLIKSVDTSDAVVNMRAAIDWLNSGPDDSIEQALYDLTAISRIQSDYKCTKFSHDILTKVSPYFERSAHQEPESRIRLIVEHFCTQHALQCREVYPRTFSQRYRMMNRGFVRELETFLNEELLKTLFDMKSNPMADNAEFYTRPIRNTDNLAEFAFKSIKTLAQADIANDYKELKHMFKRYLSKPCEYFIQDLGNDVFIPATFDAKWNQPVDGGEVDFYLGLARYRVCKYVIENEDSLMAEVENMIKY